MSKQAVSVTLAAENLLWLRGQAYASGVRSVSAVLDRLVCAARTGGQVHESAIRSVVGTLRIHDSDPQLLSADATIRALFPVSRVAESAGSYSRAKKSQRSRTRRRKAR